MKVSKTIIRKKCQVCRKVFLGPDEDKYCGQKCKSAADSLKWLNDSSSGQLKINKENENRD